MQSLKLVCLMVKEEMHLRENTLYYLDLESISHEICPVPRNRVINIAATFEVATSNGLGDDAFTRKNII